jgi:hypothetical protein
MTLGNMRHLGVQRLVAHCLNPSCRHEGLIDVSKFADDVEVPWFASRVVCAKCGARGRHIDVRPNWKEQPERNKEPPIGLGAGDGGYARQCYEYWQSLRPT